MHGLWLYLHFPKLQMDTLYHQQDLQRPVVIVDAAVNAVVQYNTQAYQAGIRKGMGLGHASALCQSLQVIPYSPDITHKTLLDVAQWLYLVTGDICPFQPDGLLLRIHTMLSLYGGLEGYWHALNSHLQSLRLHYHYATGPTPQAARLLARYGWDQRHQDADVHQRALATVPLSNTDLERKTIHSLARVGVKRLGDLMALPLNELAQRYDHTLVTYLGRIKGSFQQPVSFYQPSERFERYLELLYDIEDINALLVPVAQLLGQLSHFLKLRDQLSEEITLVLHHRDAEPQTVIVRSAVGEYRLTAWQTLCRLKLETLTLEAPVYGLTLKGGHAYIRQPDKQDLFSGQQGALSCLQLVSQLQARLGEDAVFQILPGDDPRPEYATVQHAPLRPMQLKAPVSDHMALLRPSLLLTPPKPLTHKVTLLHGPERIATGWWDNQAVIRDYFVGCNGRGEWLWLFRTPQQQWFIHGLFS
ncbi:DNA polymerase Y family protein [Aestuariibacter halophilus]|uniref:DNA polymerase Y family protein n=1 Tax=Fluctibacter halophilus TaxID=226011 RepID=A0ABS8GAN6_9ALTE|nr:DNA polymerase Y family protein [Aestuariibacter halophilus]MCC2617494.1 DNA polymerase Y family protein [Aestuariibacter halophilus]